MSPAGFAALALRPADGDRRLTQPGQDRVMTIADYLTYAIALTIAAALPGPGVIAIVARALGAGLRPALPMVCGLVVGDVIYLSAAIAGLAYIASAFGTAFLIIKYLGAAYLIWLAIGLWRADTSTPTVSVGQGGGAFFAGLLVTLGNPKTMVFYLALLPTLIDMTAITMADFSLLVAVTALVLMATLIPYAAAAGRARTMLRTPSALKTINRIAASFLGGAATAIVVRS